MNVALLVKEFPPNVVGGTETQTMRMADALQSRGHEVTVYTKDYGEETPTDDHPYDVVRVPNVRSSPFVSTLTFVLGATLLLLRDAKQYDVLQCMMVYPNGFVGYLVSRLRGLPYFAWIRGGDYYFMKDTPGKRWSIDAVLRDTTVLVQGTDIAADVESEFDPTDVRVLGNGVELPSMRADGDDVVFVARLERWKGLDVLLEALAGTDHSLTVVGDGPEREALEAQADSLGVDAEFVGLVDPEAVVEFLVDGRVFVQPSREGEGLPNTVLEAMAVGLPPVVTDSGGLPDLVTDGETGYVVPMDDPAALRDRIETVFDEDETHERLGESARAYVEEHHSWDAIVDSLESVYDDVRAGGAR
ncbi:glycosyltransferase family 4 protein [Halomicroarcula sp. S1AR25-4]|uniref:glycosyltransferase family 4 protein n=1 Tax=Haloarcula sp. S1AR25-4 TaxID=2950538 RepID=UPI00287446F6|nr:glycosyltransferase family 4 protein [Halomicroarcula sp. S1AR25-4]MDS0276812.1 glycosyltransferase family 4 protein [Halomicroarcula sp. S1AR25-4]